MSASGKVILQLLVSKCIPVLLHGLEARTITTFHIKSLDFVINRFYEAVLFNTNNIEIVKNCQTYFSLIT